mgnify:CR=1 FL=1
MGLDMYLTGKRYISRYFNGSDAELAAKIQELFPELKGQQGLFGDFSAVKGVDIDVGYWRKANAVHDWFVRECQEGEDDCRASYVSRDKLMALRRVCEEVLADPETAKEELPTTSGFFFGSTDYDEWYFEDLKKTITIIDHALALPEDWEFEYRSSW